MLDFKRLQRDADQGVLPALIFLGDIYLNGYEEDNIEPDLQQAIKYYTKAVEGGSEDAMLNLGYIYCSNKYMEPDYTTGIAYYEQAAALGNTTALGNIGMCYCNGYGVEKDEKKGFTYFMKAAEGGHPMAMNQISDMYREGIGVEPDAKQAAYWYQRAQEQKELDEKNEKEQSENNSQNTESSFQTRFEQNLKFISKDSMDTTFARQIFDENGNLRQFTLGECMFPTGKLLTADPLYYLRDPKSVCIKEKTIAPGSYPVQLSIMDSDIAGLRIVGARLKVSTEDAEKYVLANGLVEKDGKMKSTFAGFPVECGMACFCDEQAAQSYWKFLSDWYNKHQDGNIYTDYFAELFAQSYKNQPDYQREGGDLLLWTNPLDNSQIAMFASGLGDGYYTDYWGLDAAGEICELIVIFLNPELF